MKHYVPNLIPERHRVLPDYFGKPVRPEAASAPIASAFFWNALAIAAAIAALLVMDVHRGLTVSLLVFAFFASGWGKQVLERSLRFRFTHKLKAATLGVLSLLGVMNGFEYQARLDQAAERQRLAILADQKAQQAARRREALRLDSLQSYLTGAEEALEQKAYAKSIRLYTQSLRFVTVNEPEKRRQLHRGLATGYLHTQQYGLAINAFDELGNLDNETLYQQALCYQRVGRKTEALANLLQASQAGHRPSTKLYDKLNPLLRKLLYYQTVCCDGSYSPSNAKGSGACSHHGGVCDWNFPIYETYRKYAVNDF